MKLMRIMPLVCLILCGCNGSVEPNDYAYVVAVGVDKSETEGNYDFSFQYAKTTEISGGSGEEGGKGGSETVSNIKITAPSLYAAVNLGNSMLAKRLTLSHAKIFVFSEEVAKEGISQFLNTIERSEQIRPHTYLAVSVAKASDYLEYVSPMNAVNPTKYYSMIFENRYADYIPKEKSTYFYFNLSSPDRESVIPLCAVSKEGEDPSGEIAIGFEYMLKDYSNGVSDMKKEDKSEEMGGAVFSGDRYVGRISSIESEIYNMITGTWEGGYFTYMDQSSPDGPITVYETPKRPPKIRVETENGYPVIYVSLYSEADFVSSPPEFVLEKRIEGFEEQATAQKVEAVEKFLTKMSAEMGYDIFGFGGYAKRNFSSYAEFEAYEWKDKFKKATFRVEVDFDIRRTGILNK